MNIFLLVNVLLIIINSQAHAYQLKADYKIDSNLSQEELDSITQPYLKVGNSVSVSLSFSLKEEWLRVYQKKQQRSEYDAGSALKTMAVTPEAKRIIDKLNQTVRTKMIEEVYLYQVFTQKGLKTHKKHTMDNQKGESYINKQSYWSLAPKPNMCQPSLYLFPDIRMNQLLGCKLKRKIDEGRLTKTGGSHRVVLQYRPQASTLFRETNMACDNYQSTASLTVGEWGDYCIRFIDGVPIALIHIAYQKTPDNKDNTYKVYRLLNLDMAADFDAGYFDFSREEVCPSGKKRCRY